MTKNTTLNKLFDIYKIIDASMTVAFFYMTYMFLFVDMEYTFSTDTIDIETLHELSYDFINYYGNVISWFIYTRTIEVIARVAKCAINTVIALRSSKTVELKHV